MKLDYSTLIYWVREREAIRVRKSSFEKGRDSRVSTGGEMYPTLSEDPIFAEYRFCNVRREDDRVTVWIRENIREKFADHPHLWFMLCIARMINWPDTLQYAISAGGFAWPSKDGRWQYGRLEEVLTARRERKHKVWTGAYLIPSGPVKGEFRETHICGKVLNPLWEDRSRFEDAMFSMPDLKMEDLHHVLTTFTGWGPFMAYQVAVDLRFTRYLRNAPDIQTWAAAGPGTLRGLNRMYGRDVNFRLSQDQARDEMRAIYRTVPDAAGVEMDFTDVPNILCEVDKYIRLKNGEGKVRARYVPGRGY